MSEKGEHGEGKHCKDKAEKRNSRQKRSVGGGGGSGVALSFVLQGPITGGPVTSGAAGLGVVAQDGGNGGSSTILINGNLYIAAGGGGGKIRHPSIYAGAAQPGNALPGSSGDGAPFPPEGIVRSACGGGGVVNLGPNEGGVGGCGAGGQCGIGGNGFNGDGLSGTQGPGQHARRHGGGGGGAVSTTQSFAGGNGSAGSFVIEENHSDGSVSRQIFDITNTPNIYVPSADTNSIHVLVCGGGGAGGGSHGSPND